MTIANGSDDVEEAPKTNSVVFDADDLPSGERTATEKSSTFHREDAELKKALSSVRIHGPIPGDNEFDENDAPVRYVVNEWAQGTSIHGVPFVTDNIQWRFWKRATWIVLVLVSTGFMLWQITQVITQYRDFEVITDTQTIVPINLHFPEVTVCNSNMFSRSRKEATGIEEPQNTEELIAISQPFEEFMYQTWFNGRELNSSEVWKPKIVSGGGRCWSFKTDTKVRQPGYYGGLKFYVDLGQNDFEENAEYAAAFVWALQPGTNVTRHTMGNAAKAGQETFMAMEYTEYHREKTLPWARCQGQSPEYSQYACRAQCAYDWVRENCRCRDVGDHSDSSIRICERYGSDKECYEGGLDEEEELLEACDCALPPCYEEDYKFSLVEVEPALNAVARYAREFNVTEDYVRNNFIGITVNFERMQYNKLTESKGLSFAQLLASIGGSMGFFLGISLVSIFELFGDLVAMRLIPRYFGYKNLYGVGAHVKDD